MICKEADNYFRQEDIGRDIRWRDKISFSIIVIDQFYELCLTSICDIKSMWVREKEEQKQ